MQFHDYLESTYVKTNIALQQAYHPYGQGKILATQGLINGQRRFLTYVNYVAILFQYLLVLCHIKAAPPTSVELISSMKQAAEKQQIESKQAIDLERQAQIQAHLDAQKAQTEAK